MSRRVSLPGASELFRRTEAPESVQPGTSPSPAPAVAASPASSSPASSSPVSSSPVSSSPVTPDAVAEAAEGTHTGRVRHDEKMTVYVSAAELVALEQARLTLRAEHGLKVDRGRLVRAAVALALADLTQRGDDCELVRQLREQ